MPTLEVTPNAGILRRFPEHKMTGDKKQYVQQLWNLINLDQKTYKVSGASRYDTTVRPGQCTWLKRIYYSDGPDPKRYLFAVIGNKIYKGNDSTATLSQVKISESTDFSLEQNFFPIDSVLKVAGNVSTFLVDGKYFYKFNGNEGGDWERLSDKTDVDGNTIEPVYITEYLDRMWVLVKNRNVILGSRNLNPEVFNHATDSVLIELPPGNGGFPKALAVHPNGYLYIIHEDYLVPLSGSSPATFGVAPGDIVKGYGTRAPRSVVIFPDTIGFLNSKDNEYYKMSNLVSPLSYPIKLRELINPVKADQTHAAIDSNLNALRIAYWRSGEITLGDEEIYSLDEEKWCGQTRGRNISCYAQWNGNGDDGRLTTGRSDTGRVMVNDASIDFDSTAIRIWWISASYVADDAISDIQFEDLFIDGKPTGNYTVPIRYYIDSRMTTYGEASMNLQGEQFGSFPMSIAEQRTFVNRIPFLINRRKGRMIRFEIDAQDSERPFEMYGLYARYNKEQAKYTKFLVGG